MMGNDSLVSGRLALEGEFYGIRGTLGVPLVIGNQGVERIIQLAVVEDEKRLLLRDAPENRNPALFRMTFRPPAG